MPFLLGSCWDEVGSTVNESVTVTSEEMAIYTLSKNLTVQIYVKSSNADLRTSDVNRKHCSHRVRSPRVQVNVGTPDKHRDFRRAQLDNQPAPLQVSGLPTWVGTSDWRRQPANRATGVGTLGFGQDFRRPQSPHRLSDWESELPA